MNTRDLFDPANPEDFASSMRRAADYAYCWATFCINWSENLIKFRDDHDISKHQVETLFALKKDLEQQIRSRTHD